jgi:hypothetical protein
MKDAYVHEMSNPNSKRVHHTKFISQTRKGSLVQRFYENIDKLFLGWHMYQNYVLLLHNISQKVVSHLYMFGYGMEHWIFGYAYGTGCITHERNVGALLTKITQGIGDPKNWERQLEATTYSASVVEWATLDCLRDDQSTNEEPKN